MQSTFPVNVGAALISGAVGAISLNLMHECTRNSVSHPPRVDIIGMRAVAAIARKAGEEPPEHLHLTALAGDLATNTGYFSLVGLGGVDNAIATGAVTGLAAGIGVLVLPEPLGIGGPEVNRTVPTQIMAAGMYLAAGVIAGTLYRLLAKR